MFKKVTKKHKLGLALSESAEAPVSVEKLGRKRHRGMPGTQDVPTTEIDLLLTTKFVEAGALPSKKQIGAADASRKIDGFFEIPPECRIDNSRLTQQDEPIPTGMKEIELSMAYTLDNLEPTEALKRRFLGHSQLPEPRFQHLHEKEYEVFKAAHAQARRDVAEQEKLEDRYYLKGKRFKQEKEARQQANQQLEASTVSRE